MQARPLAKLQYLGHFDFGQEPAGVTDRLIVCERRVGEYETPTGDTSQVRLSAREKDKLPKHLLLT